MLQLKQDDTIILKSKSKSNSYSPKEGFEFYLCLHSNHSFSFLLYLSLMFFADIMMQLNKTDLISNSQDKESLKANISFNKTYC